MKDLLHEIERWRREGEQIALATLVAVHGSAPRRPGARMALTRSGRMAGSVSAGCVENDVFARALQVLAEGKPALARYGISNELALRGGPLLRRFDRGADRALRRDAGLGKPCAWRWSRAARRRWP